MMTPVYLACPYTHESKYVRERRFNAANAAAAYLFERGFNVLSPISHSHPIAEYMSNSKDSDFWCNVDEYWQKQCDILFVLKIDGCEQSTGVRREIDFALKIGQKIIWIDPVTYNFIHYRW